MYKNCIDKDPGVNTSVSTGCPRSVNRLALHRTEASFLMGLLSKLASSSSHVEKDWKCMGMWSVEHTTMACKTRGTEALTCRSQLMCYIFLAYNAFRFPFSYMLARNMNADRLTAIFWDIMPSLKLVGFRITFTCMDGASVNRSFSNFITRHNPPIARNLTSLNDTLSCFMGISHVVKKNSLYSSGIQPFHKRKTSPLLAMHNGHIFRMHSCGLKKTTILGGIDVSLWVTFI